MTFTIDPNNLPSVGSYNEALSVYASARPLRNGNGDRYLHMYDKNKRVALDPANQDVIFYYYNTDVVRWHKDNSVTINMGGWYTTPTRTFASMLSGHMVSISKHNTMVCGKAIDDRATIKDGVVISGSVPVTKLVVDRKRAIELMRPWQHVLLHAKALYAMDNYVFYDRKPWVLSSEAIPPVDQVDIWVREFARWGDNYEKLARRLRNRVYTLENGALVKEVVIPA